MNLLQITTEPNFYFSGEPWFDFISRFFVNSISLFILVRRIYLPNNGQSKLLFVYYLTGTMIFLISSALDQVTLNIGVALGLFAIFGIIRFRTPSVGLKQISYLFIAIGMAVINGLVEFNIGNWTGLIFVNFIILFISFIMEKYKAKTTILKKSLTFSPLNFNVLDNEVLLIEEIKATTGLEIISVEILKLNKTKNEVVVEISFNRKDYSPFSAGNDNIKEAENLIQQGNLWHATRSDEY